MPKRSQKEKYVIELKTFDLSQVRRDSTVVFIGRRRSGKSFTLRELMYSVRDISSGLVISGSEHASPFFEDFIPSSFIYKDYDESILENLMKQLAKKKKRARKKKREFKDTAFLVLDDMNYDKSWVKDKAVREIFMNGRHFNLMFIITLQYPLGIGPDLRGNIDYTFLYNTNIDADRDRIFTSFAGVLKTRQIFDQYMNALEEFECLVIDNACRSSNLSDCVYIYKGKQTPSFKVGCKKYWQLHYEYMKNNPEESSDDDESTDDEDAVQAMSYGGRKNLEFYNPKSKKMNLKIKRQRNRY